MAFDKIIRLLQIFADGGDGSGNAGASDSGQSVVTSDDDGRARLQALGVPADKIRNGRNYSVNRNAQQDDAAREQTPGARDSDMIRKSDVEKIVQKRVANMHTELAAAKEKADLYDQIAPGLKTFIEENGLSPDTDLQTLSKYMRGEYESKALEMGVSERTAMEMDMRERKAQEQQRRDRYTELQSQAEQFKQIVPNFDLQHEIKTNPKFARYTSPDVGMSVEEAFRAIYGDQMNQALANTVQRRSQEMVANAIASGSRRPSEGGINSQAPATVPNRSYADMSREERERLKRAIMGTTGGTHLRPGDRY